MFLPLSTSCFLLAYLALAQHRGVEKRDVVLIKIGGSSITDKAQPETLNTTALAWFSGAIAAAAREQDPPTDFVVVHGAGSFGHFVAKEYGLGGKTKPPPVDNDPFQTMEQCGAEEQEKLQRKRFGLSLTRNSVQKLNHAVVESLVQAGVPAVSLSPCFSIPGLQAHGSPEDPTVQAAFLSAIRTTLQAGFVPVLHGDACLYGTNDVGILSGDTIMQLLGTAAPWISRSIFLTDVDGVYTADPRADPLAVHIPRLYVNENGDVWMSDDETTMTAVDASGSQHRHDVTGGFKTKLEAATSIAAAGKVVAIAKCGSAGASAVIRSNSVQVDDPLVSYLIPKASSS